MSEVLVFAQMWHGRDRVVRCCFGFRLMDSLRHGVCLDADEVRRR
jgi:hypothetical protein